MTKEQKCISKELAIELQQVANKFGFELPESEYYRIEDLAGGTDNILAIGKLPDDYLTYAFHRAYDISELGEMLPKNIKSYWLTIIKVGGNTTNWSVRYMENLLNKETKKWHWSKMDSNMAEAMGKMLIYLIKNKLI